MVKIVIIQGSMNKNSRTSIVIDEVVDVFKKKADVELIDLRKLDMQFCDGRSIEEYNEDMQSSFKKIKEADGIVIGMPVYQFSVAGPLKNFIDVCSRAFTEKKFSIVCNSGGVRSYLASADLMKILVYEVSAIIIPPTVHSWAGNFKEGKLTDEHVKEKINEMSDALLKEI